MAQARKNNNNNNARSSKAKNNARSAKNNAKSCGERNSNSKELENMKYEIAKEFGVNLGANSSARENGSVGGEITKRLVEKAKSNGSRSSRSKK